MVPTGYMPATPTFFRLIATRGHHGSRTPHFGFLNKSQPDPWVHANGGPHGHHLYRPWQWASTSPTGACHVCAWHHSIKGQVHQPFAHFLAEHGLGHI